jgi:primosomal protein N'
MYMYILRVIPLKRRIPGGELTYISKTNIMPGSILEVPLKKSSELVIVVKSSGVEKEKEYIKSINFKLTTLANSEPVAVLNKKVLNTIFDFSEYCLCSVDTIIRALLSKISFENTKNKINSNSLLISTKENKKSDLISFHKSISYFFNSKNTIKEIVIDNPKALSYYGQNYLGFDPTVFFIHLAKNLEIPISFNKSGFVLAYKEWDFKKNNQNSELKGDLDIIVRNPEDNKDKANPLSIEMVNVLKQNLNKKILILSNTKNFALKTICHDCSTVHNCTNCNNPFILVKNNRNYAKKYGIAGDYIFVCPNCSLAENSIAKCRNCDSWNLVALGYGTEKIIEQLKDTLNKKEFVAVCDMTDKIGAKNLKSYQENGGIIITRPNYIYEIGEADIILIPSISPILYSKEFSSSEFARDLLNELCYISKNTYLTVMNENEKDFLEEKEEAWLKNEIFDRKSFYYPPYGRYVRIELDAYASLSTNSVNAVFDILKSLSLKDTVSKEKNQFGNVIFRASFSNSNWSLNSNIFQTAQNLKNGLYPFLKHLKIEVY